VLPMTTVQPCAYAGLQRALEVTELAMLNPPVGFENTHRKSLCVATALSGAYLEFQLSVVFLL